MDIDLGRRADYAIRCVLHLAQVPEGTRRTAGEIAQDMDVPRSWVPTILGQLVRHGIVTSVPGRMGGYELAVQPAQVTMFDVITAVEHTDGEADCVLRGGPCRWDGRCAVHEPWAAAKEALRDRLRATTFEELVRLDRGLD